VVVVALVGEIQQMESMVALAVAQGVVARLVLQQAALAHLVKDLLVEILVILQVVLAVVLAQSVAMVALMVVLAVLV
jgi:hypothetical protein